MKNLTSSFFFLCFIHALFSQQNINLFSRLEFYNKECPSNLKGEIIIQKHINNKNIDIIKYTIKDCFPVFPILKDEGDYIYTVKVDNYKPRQIKFTVKENTEKIDLGKIEIYNNYVLLKSKKKTLTDEIMAKKSQKKLIESNPSEFIEFYFTIHSENLDCINGKVDGNMSIFKKDNNKEYIVYEDEFTKCANFFILPKKEGEYKYEIVLNENKKEIGTFYIDKYYNRVDLGTIFIVQKNNTDKTEPTVKTEISKLKDIEKKQIDTLQHSKIINTTLAPPLHKDSISDKIDYIVLKTAIEGIDCSKKIKGQISIERFIDDEYKEILNNYPSNCNIEINIPRTAGNYKIKYSFERAEMIEKEFKIEDIDASVIDIGTVKLDLYQEISNVTVKAQKKEFIKIDPDKTTINVSNNDLLKISSIYDALTKLPGIFADSEGNILLKGKNVAIWIDGLPNNLGGNQLVNYLRSIPASMVEKIEIIPNPGASYDANSSNGIINIITKGVNIKGNSKSINLTYNQSEYYSSISTGGGIYGKNNGFSYGVSLGLNRSKSVGFGENKRTIDNGDTPLKIINTLDDISNNKFIYTSINGDYTFPDKKTSLGASYMISFDKNDPIRYGQTVTENYSSPFELNTISRFDNNSSSQDFRTYFKTNIDDNDNTISTDFSWNSNKEAINNPLTEEYKYSVGNRYSLTERDFKLNNYALKTDFKFNVVKDLYTLNSGFKYNLLKVNNNGNYLLGVADETLLENPNFNDNRNFDYKQTNVALYADNFFRLGKLTVNAGVRMETYKGEAQYNKSPFYIDSFVNFYPSGYLFYDLGIVKLISTYSRRINQPHYSYIDPNFVGYFDSTTNKQGVRNLSSEIQNNFSFKATVFEYSYLEFNYSISNRANYPIYNVDNLTVTQTYKTFDNIRNLSVDLLLPVPFDFFSHGFKFLENTSSLNPNKMNYLVLVLGYNKTTISDPNNELLKPIPYYNLGLYFHILLPHEIKFITNYWYVSKGGYGINRIERAMQSLNFTFTKTFNKKFDVSLHFQDVLNSYLYSIAYKRDPFSQKYDFIADNRSIRLSLSYMFGNYKAKKAKEEEEEIFNKIDKQAPLQEGGP